jgi:hypothetical protein
MDDKSHILYPFILKNKAIIYESICKKNVRFIV